jgi:uncharacterized protein YgbK (DUF1537 family)
MTTFFGAIADDFTGATDLASLLARSGARVTLRLGLPVEPPTDAAPIEIVALKCRTAPVAEAVSEAVAALRWLREAGAKRFFWKYCSTFDSTPRGNIGPVAEALMKVVGTDQTIYCPAFPENGRSIFMGNLFVGDQPLAESSMKDHPLTPMRDSNLLRLLQPQVTAPVGLANRHVVARGPATLADRLAELRAAGVPHVVVDAVTDDDLTIIAQACRDMPLLTGGSAVAMPLPKIWRDAGWLAPADDRRRLHGERGAAIVLSGSCSAMTNRQVAAYRAQGRPGYRLDPLRLVDSGAGSALDWLAAQSPDSSPLLYATAEPESVRSAQEKLGAERVGAMVEEVIAACAVRARDLGYGRFVVAGGETSGSVARALGLTRLDIGPEIAAGVPWCFARADNREIAVALKSGNFGDESFFSRALEVLQS